MKFITIGTLVCATSILAGCGSGSGDGEVPPLLGPGATEAEAEAAILALEAEVEDVFIAEGVTEYAALPMGSATYTGLIYGSTEMDYAADLDLTVEFDSDGVTGTVYNFVTDITDFNNPTGTIDVTGSVDDNVPNAGISFSGSGILTGTNGVTAEYDLLNAEGQFGGIDGSVMGGEQTTDFNWQTGPNAGNTFFSDGAFAATRD